ncbi:MAG: DegQ family serine endoprotease [Spirochaeta sp.]|jgi:Do/DeqQ family serine protease|nr:DegQ family serine endoprotease [Spirochaeta sp.]
MKKLLAINLVLLGLIGGFVLSVGLFSCSTNVEPARQALAQDGNGAQSEAIRSAETLQQSFRAVSQQALPSVVRIDVEEVRTQTRPGGGDDTPWFDFFFGEPDSEDENGEEREFRTQGLGSGVIVRRDGNRYYVLTNDHVIGNASEITVTLDDGSDYTAEIVGKDARKDLAMISFESTEQLSVAALGNSDDLQVGDWVLAIGSPFGFQSTVTAGIVSAVGRRGGPAGNISDFIQTDAAINRGNSGGALVNLEGQVVGINTWITSQTGGSVGLGFSIPINNVIRSIDDFIETGAVRYGWLGVSIRSVSDDVAADLGLPDQNGALVHHVFLDSPADRGGLRPGDFIVEINGVTVTDSDELVLEVGELPVGEDAEFKLIRHGERREISVRIAERESERQIANLNARLWPGFSVFPISDEIRAEMEIAADTSGVVVATVENRTPAAAAGLRVGDVVSAIDGTSVSTMLEFYQELPQSGETTEITILRDGETETVTLERE